MESVLQPPPPFLFENNLLNVTSGNLSAEWENWKKSFKIYYEACELEKKSEKVQKHILLHIIGDRCREVYDQFEEETKTIESIFKKFDEFFIPQKNLAVERHKFFKRNQKDMESTEQYVFELNKIAAKCEFGTLREDLVCSRFICGVTDVGLSERMLRVPDIKLDKALEICKLAEMSRMQALNIKTDNYEKQVHEISQNKDNSELQTRDVHLLNRRRPAFNRARPPPLTPWRSNASSGAREQQPHRYNNQLSIQNQRQPSNNVPSRSTAPDSSANNNRSFNNTATCGNCGRAHRRMDCPAYGVRCNNCNRMNHYARMCRSARRVYAIQEDSTDQGWDDVSFHGSDQIMTPNIDVLAYQGVVLHQYYSDTQGTPARSALFTGKYPMRLGTQSDSLSAMEDRGIPVSERLLPAFLREQGYATHLVGKWHVGKSREHYLPTNRGFNTFYGFLDGAVDYYTYNLVENFNGSSYFGLNMYDNLVPVEDQNGHLTEILTERAVNLIREHDKAAPLYLHMSHAAPHVGGGLVSLQPPPDALTDNSHIAHSARRLYAGLVSSLDKSVGNIVSALAEREMLTNTLIVFVSDNGAAGLSQSFGSNLPLRGVKGTPWEGAARAIAIVWHPAVPPKINDALFHVTDWLPTLVSAAGGNPPKNIDGIDQWASMIKLEKSKRYNVLVTIDDLNGYAAFREGDFKIIVGNVSKESSKYHGKELKAVRRDPLPYENVLLASETYLVFKETLELPLDIDLVYELRNNSNIGTASNDTPEEAVCFPTFTKGCLFNVSGDPLEARDLWYANMDIVRRMSLRLRALWTEMNPRSLPKMDPRADPSKQNYTWFAWVPNDEKIKEPRKTVPHFPLQVSRDELQYVVDINLNTFKDKLHDYIKSMGDSFVRSVGGLFNF